MLVFGTSYYCSLRRFLYASNNGVWQLISKDSADKRRHVVSISLPLRNKDNPAIHMVTMRP